MEEASENKLWSMVRRIFGSRCDASLEEAIREASEEGEIKTEEVSMLLSILRLHEKQAVEIMVPRTDLVCAEENDTLKQVAESIMQSGHSRLPVYRDNKDHMVGLIHAKDLLQHFFQEGDVSVKTMMREPHFIPETKNVRQILMDFRSQNIHLGIVLDEYGGTSGIVTLEDVLEEIVGEIEDEYDPPRPQEVQVMEDGSYHVAGRTTLDELAEYGISIPSEQVETVGGYVSHLAGKVPEKGEEFSDTLFKYVVLEANTKNIQWLEIRPLSK
ncbi:hemolysin family protein [Desulfonatronospira sp.]|uniref:hemolysin family protein n=1 Tax=Desulfonatronospira sp. TaxID=1962951 RepID=UPI0025C55E0F|nr:hemolysin family protein [Desulfonatronospira sp.]